MNASSDKEAGQAAADAEGAPQAIDEAAAEEVATVESAPADVAAAASARPERDFSYTRNRELSWLDFNRRVLEEALDETVPLLERLKFVAIFDSNLDEFFMVRVGSLTDMQIIAPDDRDNKSNMTAAEQIDAIFEAVRPLIDLRNEIHSQLMGELAKYGICELHLEEMGKDERKFARKYFRDHLRPVLSPQVIDERHPFPHLKNKALYVAMPLTDEDGITTMGLVPVPEGAPSSLANPDRPMQFVRTEQIIAHNAKKLFGIYKTGKPCVISVTRNADISFDEEKFADDEGDYRLHVSRLLKKRNRLNPVRLEVQGDPDPQVLETLLTRLKLKPEQVFVYDAPISLQGVYGFEKRMTPALKAELCRPSHQPRSSAEFDQGSSILDQIERRDRILFYPYDSMEPFLRMLQEAAADPTVISVKITLYRLADDSRVAQYLCEAAENGKEVTVLMELRARFDEANNIDWSERLEEAGCNVIYGMENYKCHSKICLITRRKRNGQLVKLVQIGTGNYNEKTARLYTDISLFTADEGIGTDAVSFFQNMLIGNLNGAYTKLLVAPATMKRTIIELIDREIGKGADGRIILKANSVTDRDVIDKLAEASQAGVRVDMNIRGICCLVPGIEGVTDNIHVRTIVGQFLEHSRIYVFGTGDDLRMYISSADLMTRNLVHRVEVACPIEDADVQAAIMRFLEKIFADNTKARVILSDGSRVPVAESPEADESAEPLCMQGWCAAHPLQGGVSASASPRAAVRNECSGGGPVAKLRALFGGK